ncbi:MerR family transcriptional regulator [Tsukamurella sp. M9C]|uniref:MerR family transcriptional regulator n=1 Tax=unclassified Tsukamurella TaxID=2633480 RepID=UPI001CCBC967|nr:MerR family transcriptional regulator [Tsukamurella sp. M9C]MCA0155727.1 MerR family transcriptional regulator [Tsukamurella sp. M9C]
MHIGDLSRRTGVNAHQLRYYEAQALLDPGRTAAGYRVYSEDDVVTVRQIRHLLAAGLSTDDIAYLLPCARGEAPQLFGCPELIEAMRGRLDRLDDQIGTLTRSRAALAHYIDEAARLGAETYGPFGAGAAEQRPTAARR